MTIGDEETASFWRSSWLGDRPLSRVFPVLFKHSRRKNGTVSAALHKSRWIQDLRHGEADGLIHEFLALWRMLRAAGTTINPGQRDVIRWTKHASGQFSTRLAYPAAVP